ncbi:MAG: AAA family ATPase [Chloroflexi bacterium]|nr:AAA family ATPase [Chloroflexota bacterium]
MIRPAHPAGPPPREAPIEVPVPSLVVLVGPAGSGKSTLAARLFAADEVLSSDALRAAIGGDAANQRATRPAFAVLHREVRRRLAGGRLVVVDATNVELTARRALVRLAADAGLAATAIVLALRATEVHARNLGRSGRVVPADVVDRHLAAMARLGHTPEAIATSLRNEGFAAAAVVTTPPELDALAIARSRSTHHPLSAVSDAARG